MKPFSKTLTKFAVKNKIPLGQWGEGHGQIEGFYHIIDHSGCSVFGGQRVSHVSTGKTVKSAMIMMNRYLRQTK